MYFCCLASNVDSKDFRAALFVLYYANGERQWMISWRRLLCFLPEDPSLQNRCLGYSLLCPDTLAPIYSMLWHWTNPYPMLFCRLQLQNHSSLVGDNRRLCWGWWLQSKVDTLPAAQAHSSTSLWCILSPSCRRTVPHLLLFAWKTRFPRPFSFLLPWYVLWLFLQPTFDCLMTHY